jgi:hypothetical protein
MRIEIGKVGSNQVVGLPTDELDVSPMLRGELGVKIGPGLVPGMSDVVILDSGRHVYLTADVEVEVFEDVSG